MSRSIVNILNLFVIPAMILFSQCIEPFDTSIPGGNNLLVIEGEITDQPGPYQVKLSRSSLLTENNFPMVSGAFVEIEEENGATEVLTEVSDGVYETDVNGMQGVAGNRYRLRITLPDTEQYASDWILLKPSPSIERVDFEFEEQLENLEPKKGAQIYVSSGDPQNLTKFYRYEYVETWQYQVPFFPKFNYLGNDQIEPLPNIKYFCWMTEESRDIKIATSDGNENDVVSRVPLVYISTDPDRLKIRYSLLVKQYALTEEEYIFWSGLEETSNASGSLFDKQPQTISSNVRNVNSPGELVLGYFSVSGVSQSRIFIDADDLPEDYTVPDLLTEDCLPQLDTIPKRPGADQLVFEAIENGMLFYDFDQSIFIVGYVLINPPCGDCEYYGGVAVEPEFWEE